MLWSSPPSGSAAYRWEAHPGQKRQWRTHPLHFHCGQASCNTLFSQANSHYPIPSLGFHRITQLTAYHTPLLTTQSRLSFPIVALPSFSASPTHLPAPAFAFLPPPLLPLLRFSQSRQTVRARAVHVRRRGLSLLQQHQEPEAKVPRPLRRLCRRRGASYPSLPADDQVQGQGQEPHRRFPEHSRGSVLVPRDRGALSPTRILSAGSYSCWGVRGWTSRLDPALSTTCPLFTTYPLCYLLHICRPGAPTLEPRTRLYLSYPPHHPLFVCLPLVAPRILH